MNNENIRKIREIYDRLTIDLKKIEKDINLELEKPFEQMNKSKVQELMDQMTILRKKAQKDAEPLWDSI